MGQRSGRTWYTSDLHIGHRLVARHRGFDTPDGPDIDAHDLALASTWDAKINEHDTVWVLGDISMSGGTSVLEWIAARPGTKHLISGNHDPVHPMHRDAIKHLPRFLEVFATVQPFLRKKLVGNEVLLSHFPYADCGDGPARPGTRYEQYRLPDLGAFLLHGHTHGQERAHGHSLHVGLDAWKLSPVPQEEIIAWILGHPSRAA